MKTVSFVKRKFNAMLGVATVSMAVNFVVMLSGSLVAGNLLGKEGLAGLNVCTPVCAVAMCAGGCYVGGTLLRWRRRFASFPKAAT